MNIEAKVSIILDKIKKISANIYVDGILDQGLVVDTSKHEEGSIKDGLEVYTSRLTELINKNIE